MHRDLCVMDRVLDLASSIEFSSRFYSHKVCSGYETKKGQFRFPNSSLYIIGNLSSDIPVIYQIERNNEGRECQVPSAFKVNSLVSYITYTFSF
jgi:hypothetical protein